MFIPNAGSVGSRRLLALFAVTTLLPAAGLTWLGWRLVQQDRSLEQQRMREIREHAADLGSAALQRLLAEIEEGLSTALAGAPGRLAELSSIPRVENENSGTFEI